MIDDQPHATEHAIETQLPFLIRTLGCAVPVLPVVVGTSPPSAVALLLSTLLDMPGTIAVVSTDLSHYLDRAQAREHDTATAIVARRGEALHPADACGFHPLRGLLRHAVDRDHLVELLQLATSADTAGDPRRVVGYGAFVLHQNTASDRPTGQAQQGGQTQKLSWRTKKSCRSSSDIVPRSARPSNYGSRGAPGTAGTSCRPVATPE